MLEGSEENRFNQIQAIKDLTKAVKESAFLVSLAFLSAFASIGLAIVSLGFQTGRIGTFIISALFLFFSGPCSSSFFQALLEKVESIYNVHKL